MNTLENATQVSLQETLTGKDEKEDIDLQQRQPPPKKHDDLVWKCPCCPWRVKKSTLICVLILASIATVAIVPTVLFLPHNRSQSPQRETLDQPDTGGSDAQANITIWKNPYTRPLSEKFRYGEEPIRGINLGGWLVLEPFITPSLFDAAQAKDEWDLCRELGPTQARQQLERHYETFITQQDFERIASMGLNHVRIPVGHWAIRTFAGEPFVPQLSWKYLLRGIQWARQYGLRVMVELHTAPGSQNGWNHSGRSGTIGWINGTDGPRNAERTLSIVDSLVRFFDHPDWADVVTIIGVLNEPGMIRMEPAPVKEWYRESYDMIRSHSSNSTGPWLTYHDGFLGLPPWTSFFRDHYQRVFLEAHLYLIFDTALVAMVRHKQAELPCQVWRPMIQESTRNAAPTMIGEFSLATNDCGKYLNGFKLGNRYEGTMQAGGVTSAGNPACATCSCGNIEDWAGWDEPYKLFLKKFVEHQMDAFESGVGWFFWTYKTEEHINPHWDYLLGWEQGWIPRNANNRTFTCQ